MVVRYDKKDGDWMNVQSAMSVFKFRKPICVAIYEVRPLAIVLDFPHLKKKKVTDYIHVHQQNIAVLPSNL
jgi:hypothetical protein